MDGKNKIEKESGDRCQRFLDRTLFSEVWRIIDKFVVDFHQFPSKAYGFIEDCDYFDLGILFNPSLKLRIDILWHGLFNSARLFIGHIFASEPCRLSGNFPQGRAALPGIGSTQAWVFGFPVPIWIQCCNVPRSSFRILSD